jgi:translation initiation factor 2B subunit (eIF-2B alpha/beta/delta family)
MKTLMIQPSNKSDYRLFIDLAKRLNVDYLEQEVPTQKEFLDGLERSIEDVKKYRKGEITLRNAFDLINEL